MINIKNLVIVAGLLCTGGCSDATNSVSPTGVYVDFPGKSFVPQEAITSSGVNERDVTVCYNLHVDSAWPTNAKNTCIVFEKIDYPASAVMKLLWAAELERKRREATPSKALTDGSNVTVPVIFSLRKEKSGEYEILKRPVEERCDGESKLRCVIGG